jgi:hypothetical protein
VTGATQSSEDDLRLYWAQFSDFGVDWKLEFFLDTRHTPNALKPGSKNLAVFLFAFGSRVCHIFFRQRTPRELAKRLESARFLGTAGCRSSCGDLRLGSRCSLHCEIEISSPLFP